MPARACSVPVVAFLLSISACTEPSLPSGPELSITREPLLLAEGAGSFRLSRDGPARNAAPEGTAFLDGDPFSFGSMFRRDAATSTSHGMSQSGDSAFFRDATVSTTHALRASSDGQTWRLDIIHPSGFVETGPTITFRRSFNGQSDCFLFGGFGGTLCGSELAFLFTTLNVQCANTGLYFIKTFVNGAAHASGEADWRLVPRIPPGLTRQLQTSFPNTDYDDLCTYGSTTGTCQDETDPKVSIRQKGCALTAGAMVLKYWGLNTDPAALNTFLNANGGYLDGGILDWQKIVKLAADSGRRLKVGRVGASTAELRQLVCRFGPQILEVRSTNAARRGGQHFVIATGFDDNGRVLINDPASAGNTDLGAYGDAFVSVRQVQRPTQVTDTVQPGIVIKYYSPGTIMLTDPLGRRTGADPSGRGATYSGMPNGFYDEAASYANVNADGTFGVNDEDPPKEVEVSGNPDGNYVVDVFGTGAGIYTLLIQLNGPRGRTSRTTFANIPITAGDNHSYGFAYHALSAGSGEPMQLSGAFTGGGQSAAADQLLTYARPGLRQSSLPAGTSSYPLLIFYAAGLNPATFTAELNGMDVRSLFAPVPGGSQAVSVPLGSGRNVLKLSASGTANGRDVSDTDNLVFKVP